MLAEKVNSRRLAGLDGRFWTASATCRPARSPRRRPRTWKLVSDISPIILANSSEPRTACRATGKLDVTAISLPAALRNGGRSDKLVAAAALAAPTPASLEILYASCVICLLNRLPPWPKRLTCNLGLEGRLPECSNWIEKTPPKRGFSTR